MFSRLFPPTPGQLYGSVRVGTAGDPATLAATKIDVGSLAARRFVASMWSDSPRGPGVLQSWLQRRRVQVPNSRELRALRIGFIAIHAIVVAIREIPSQYWHAMCEHTLGGSSGRRLHGPDGNYPFRPTSDRTDRPKTHGTATVVLTWRNRYGDLGSKAHRSCSRKTDSPQNPEKPPKSLTASTLAAAICVPQKSKKLRKNPDICSQWVFSKDFMTKPLIPQKFRKAGSF
jgi:hypothetical protein